MNGSEQNRRKEIMPASGPDNVDYFDYLKSRSMLG